MNSDTTPAESPWDRERAAARLKQRLANKREKSRKDETDSMMQLANAVQRAAEDELSFHGSLDTRDRMGNDYGSG